jgi:hypothetical protein
MKICLWSLAVVGVLGQTDERGTKAVSSRGEKAKRLFAGLAERALYCEPVEDRVSKYIHRYNKNMDDAIWRITTGCRMDAFRRRRRRSSDVARRSSDSDYEEYVYPQKEDYFYLSDSGRKIFDYYEFDYEGFEDVNEIFKTTLKELSSRDSPLVTADDEEAINNAATDADADAIGRGLQTVESTFTKVRKVSYSLVREFGSDCIKAQKWLRRSAQLISFTSAGYKRCRTDYPNMEDLNKK